MNDFIKVGIFAPRMEDVTWRDVASAPNEPIRPREGGRSASDDVGAVNRDGSCGTIMHGLVPHRC
jgi:hypothetical protein